MGRLRDLPVLDLLEGVYTLAGSIEGVHQMHSAHILVIHLLVNERKHSRERRGLCQAFQNQTLERRRFREALMLAPLNLMVAGGS